MNAKHENQFVETSIYKEEKISMLLSQAIYAKFIYILNTHMADSLKNSYIKLEL